MFCERLAPCGENRVSEEELLRISSCSCILSNRVWALLSVSCGVFGMSGLWMYRDTWVTEDKPFIQRWANRFRERQWLAQDLAVGTVSIHSKASSSIRLCCFPTTGSSFLLSGFYGKQCCCCEQLHTNNAWVKTASSQTMKRMGGLLFIEFLYFQVPCCVSSSKYLLRIPLFRWENQGFHTQPIPAAPAEPRLTAATTCHQQPPKSEHENGDVRAHRSKLLFLCSDKTPDKEGWVFFGSLKALCVVARRRWQQQHETASHIASTWGQGAEMKPGAQLAVSPFYSVGDPSPWDGTFSVGHPSLEEENRHRRTQKRVSMVILNPSRLTVRISHCVHLRACQTFKLW